MLWTGYSRCLTCSYSAVYQQRVTNTVLTLHNKYLLQSSCPNSVRHFPHLISMRDLCLFIDNRQIITLHTEPRLDAFLSTIRNYSNFEYNLVRNTLYEE